jgi:hypothetical protein
MLTVQVKIVMHDRKRFCRQDSGGWSLCWLIGLCLLGETRWAYLGSTVVFNLIQHKDYIVMLHATEALVSPLL